MGKSCPTCYKASRLRHWMVRRHVGTRNAKKDRHGTYQYCYGRNGTETEKSKPFFSPKEHINGDRYPVQKEDELFHNAKPMLG